MKYASICIALAIVAATCSVQAASEPKQADIKSADRLFEAGKFDEAGELYARIEAQNPKDYSAILQLGRIALLANRLDDAQTWLEQALALKPGDADAKIMLAEAFYRRDDFQKAAAALNGVDVGTNKLIIEQYPTLNVVKLESFKGQTPYEVHGDGQTTSLKFLNTGPLPVVSVRVNGGEEVTFFIDSGGSELGLDTDFAKELGLPHFGDVQGTFSGGEQAEVGQSRIEQLTLGDWTVHNLPVMTLPFRQLSKGLGVKRIDGVIGTTLFYHFLATLDYPNGELVLRRKTAENLAAFAAESSGKSVAVPFWIASDHFMVGWGRVETLPPTLLFVDTGARGCRREARGVRHQGGRDQARRGQSLLRRRRGRNAEDRALHRASTFLRRRKARERRGSLRWAVPVGKHFRLPPRRHGRARFLQALCGDLRLRDDADFSAVEALIQR
jgi:predicted aspartyl protease